MKNGKKKKKIEWGAAADDGLSWMPSIINCLEVMEQIYQHIANTRIINAD
jgi:hypothetical protein